MTQRLCSHDYSLQEAMSKNQIDILLSMILSCMGSCPDCPGDGAVKLEALRSLQNEIPPPLRVGADDPEQSWKTADLIGAMTYVKVIPGDRMVISGNIGMDWSFVARYCGLTPDRKMKWLRSPAYSITLTPGIIETMAVIIPSDYGLLQQICCWTVPGSSNGHQNPNLYFDLSHKRDKPASGQQSISV